MGTLGLLAPYKEVPVWPCFPQPDGSAQVKPESRQLAAGTEIQLVVADVSHFESWDLVRCWSGAPCCSKLWSAATQVAKQNDVETYHSLVKHQFEQLLCLEPQESKVVWGSRKVRLPGRKTS